jgi:hypothetical protein
MKYESILHSSTLTSPRTLMLSIHLYISKNSHMAKNPSEGGSAVIFPYQKDTRRPSTPSSKLPLRQKKIESHNISLHCNH